LKSKFVQKKTALALVLSGCLLLSGCGGVPAGSTASQATEAPAEETAVPQEALPITQDQSAELVRRNRRKQRTGS
jgi:starvation-inducible outer membrane lipoprotein